MEPLRSAGRPALDERAAALHRHYGARPWPELPEATRRPFRAPVRDGLDGLDGIGRPPAPA